MIYLTCYQTFSANDDPRSKIFLARGHQELLRYAEQISDSELRRSFLERVPSHRLLHDNYLSASYPQLDDYGAGLVGTGVLVG
ncbi:MAG: hypothetical protein U0175_22585 [Caldilineaceae bacterium]